MELASKMQTGLCVAALLGFIGCEARPTDLPSFDVQGHRGARGLAPENTLAAFARAIELGVTTLELDVAVTQDGEVVVAHDPYVAAQRCLAAGGVAIQAERPPLFRDLTLAEVKEYDCGSLPPDSVRFPSPPWRASPGEAIPTLGEVFELARERGADALLFNVETKLQPGDERTVPAGDFVAAVIAVVREHGVAERTTLQSFDWRALVLAGAIEPRLELAALIQAGASSAAWHAGVEGPALEALAKLDAHVGIVSPDAALLTDPSRAGYIDIRAAHAAGWRVIPWTVNSAAEIDPLIDLGVDGVISDYPGVALRAARARGVLP